MWEAVTTQTTISKSRKGRIIRKVITRHRRSTRPAFPRPIDSCVTKTKKGNDFIIDLTGYEEDDVKIERPNDFHEAWAPSTGRNMGREQRADNFLIGTIGVQLCSAYRLLLPRNNAGNIREIKF